jgi:hypothetical protein
VTALTGSTATEFAVTGATTGKTYTCTVTAINARGAGLASSPSLPVVVGVPAAPTKTSVVYVSAGKLKVTFTAGSTNGSPITAYTASCTSTNGGTTGTATGTISPIKVSGLTTGDSYICVVTATNARGTSPPSSASAVVAA